MVTLHHTNSSQSATRGHEESEYVRALHNSSACSSHRHESYIMSERGLQESLLESSRHQGVDSLTLASTTRSTSRGLSKGSCMSLMTCVKAASAVSSGPSRMTSSWICGLEGEYKPHDYKFTRVTASGYVLMDYAITKTFG